LLPFARHASSLRRLHPPVQMKTFTLNAQNKAVVCQ
jgi:hypothetical protein